MTVSTRLPANDEAAVIGPFGPHHDGSELYVNKTCPSLGESVPIRIRVPQGTGVETVRVRMIQDGEPAFVQATPDGVRHGEEWFRADVVMHNPVTSYRIQLDRGPLGYSWLNGTGEHSRDITDANDFRLTTFDPGPDWALDAVVYQVFPDRFGSSGTVRELPDWAIPAGWDDTVIGTGPGAARQLFGGDLDGVRLHLAHLKELGVTTLYLTPIFPARSNHRYDASTFAMVDPLLGGDESLVRLSRACHDAGLHIVGDLTTNHSGVDHPWFQAATTDPHSPEHSFYYLGADGDYVSWLGHKSLPKFDLDSAELRERMFGRNDSVLSRWLREPFNLDGWRIDVANMTGRHGIHDHGDTVAKLIRDTLDVVRPSSVLLAEYTNDFTGDIRGDGWQGSMNYAGFARPVWSWLESPEYEARQLGTEQRLARRSGRASVDTMREFAAAVPWKVASRHWNLISSHDTARIRTVTGSAEMTRIAAALLLSYHGTPMIFAGDEIGLEGSNGEDSRRPMPWHRPASWDHETFDAYRELIAVRQAHPALRRGGLRWVLDSFNAIGFLRETADERILVVASRGPWSGALLPSSLAAQGVMETLYGNIDLTVAGGGIVLPGDGPAAGIWRLA